MSKNVCERFHYAELSFFVILVTSKLVTFVAIYPFKETILRHFMSFYIDLLMCLILRFHLCLNIDRKGSMSKKNGSAEILDINGLQSYIKGNFITDATLIHNILCYVSALEITRNKMLDTLMELFDGSGIEREEIEQFFN